MLLKVYYFRSKKVPIHRRQDSSITDGDVVRGAGDLQSRIQAFFSKATLLHDKYEILQIQHLFVSQFF